MKSIELQKRVYFPQRAQLAAMLDRELQLEHSSTWISAGPASETKDCRKSQKGGIKLRIILIGFIFSLLLIVIGVRAVHLQVFCSPWLSQEAADRYERSFTSYGKRGTIYDSNYRKMAVSIDATSIGAHPFHIKDAQAAAEAVAGILNIDNSALKQKLASERSFVWIERKATPREVEAVKDLEFEGIVFIPEQDRFYPNRTLAAQLLGFSGTDGYGLEGIEFYYNTYLKGVNGRFTALKDALGHRFDAQKGMAPNYDGNNLLLTIDTTIQHIAERALGDAVAQFSALSGIAIVMTPRTGAILAMAHYPLFNPNSFKDFDRRLWRNRAVTDQFEPGSTMKIFTAAAAIEFTDAKSDTTFFCEDGAYRIGKNVIHDIRPHGMLTLQQIVKYSSNIGAVKAGEMTGSKSLYKTLRNFGFGERTGIDAPGETAGSLISYNRWSRIDTATVSFGHGISASALQLITAVSAVANDGILMRPYTVQAVIDQDGHFVKSLDPYKVRRAISSETAKIIKGMMKSATSSEGTGARAAIEGYSVYGKTGTAQKIDETGVYVEGKYVASFIGFVSAKQPEIAILVIIDEPQKEYYGGIVAAPVFRRIASETLNYLNILPE